MPPASSPSGFEASPYTVKQLMEIQSSMFDKASTYTKVIMGIGYGGFFASWSGVKQYMSPWELVTSALLVMFSLLLYIMFEIYQAAVTSQMAISLSQALNAPGVNIPVALDAYRSQTNAKLKRYFAIWKFVFPASALTGLLGGLVLIGAFVHQLVRILQK